MRKNETRRKNDQNKHGEKNIKFPLNIRSRIHEQLQQLEVNF